MTPSERDYLIRTVIGEAANQPDEGLAAVAHVVLNRVNRGYGKNPTEVVLAKGQFEPWSTRARELWSYTPDMPVYKRAAAIVDKVASGEIPDPTKGATHFLEENIVRRRTGGKLPDWAQGQGLKIGDHTFHYPDENRVTVASNVDDDWFSSRFGSARKGPGQVQPQDAPSVPVPAAQDADAWFAKYRKQLNAPAEQQKKTLTAQTVTGPMSWDLEAAPTGSETAGVGRDIRRVGAAVANLPAEWSGSLVRNFTGGAQLARQGLENIVSGDVLPRFPSTDPRTWEAGGALRAIGGTLGAAFSPITATTEKLVEEPIEQITGSPEIAKRAGVVSNMMFPTPMVAQGVNRLRPTVQAQQEIGRVVNPAALERMAENPRLTPMDVDPSLRARAMGLAVDEGPARDLLFGRVQQRIASAPGEIREAYSAAMGPAPNVLDTLAAYKQKAADNAAKGFGEAFQNIGVINVPDVVKRIDNTIKSGGSAVLGSPLRQRLEEIRQELLASPTISKNPQRLHEIQSELGREVRELQSSAVGSERRLGRQLSNIHQKLIDEIDLASGGKYRPARQKFRSDMEIQEAFDKGSELLQNRATKAGLREDTPDAWRAWKNDATDDQIAAARLGARAMIEQKIFGLRNSTRQGIALPEVEFNLDKFKILFGEKEANRLAKLVRDEKDIAYTNNKLFENSVTAERLSARESLKPRDLKKTSVDALLPFGLEFAATALQAPPGIGMIGGGALMAGRRVYNTLGRRSDIERNRLIADALSREGAPGIEALATAIRRSQESNRLIQRPMLPITYVPPEVRESR